MACPTLLRGVEARINARRTWTQAVVTRGCIHNHWIRIDVSNTRIQNGSVHRATLNVEVGLRIQRRDQACIVPKDPVLFQRTQRWSPFPSRSTTIMSPAINAGEREKMERARSVARRTSGEANTGFICFLIKLIGRVKNASVFTVQKLPGLAITSRPQNGGSARRGASAGAGSASACASSGY